MAICIPIAAVAAVLALVYGKSVGHAWLPAIITFLITVVAGMFYGGVGQLVGVVVSALIIFLCFTLPEQKRVAHEQAMRDQEAMHLPNEEDT